MGRALDTNEDDESVQKLWNVNELLLTVLHLKHFHSVDELARLLNSAEGNSRHDL